jgi:hypothetical protein
LSSFLAPSDPPVLLKLKSFAPKLLRSTQTKTLMWKQRRPKTCSEEERKPQVRYGTCQENDEVHPP